MLIIVLGISCIALMIALGHYAAYYTQLETECKDLVQLLITKGYLNKGDIDETRP